MVMGNTHLSGGLSNTQGCPGVSNPAVGSLDCRDLTMNPGIWPKHGKIERCLQTQGKSKGLGLFWVVR